MNAPPRKLQRADPVPSLRDAVLRAATLLGQSTASEPLPRMREASAPPAQEWRVHAGRFAGVAQGQESVMNHVIRFLESRHGPLAFWDLPDVDHYRSASGAVWFPIRGGRGELLDQRPCGCPFCAEGLKPKLAVMWREQ